MERTDWDEYYRRPFAATVLTRKLTQARLLRYLRRYAPAPSAGLIVVELGGANSCFFEAVQGALHPREYHVVDSNQLGIDRMRTRLGPRSDVVYHCGDVMTLDFRDEADVVFSVGLVEHFDEAGTRRAIDAHLRPLKPGGLCIVAHPTPTALYRLTRGVAELLGAWRFPDERPLGRDESASAIEARADILDESIVWPILLTQLFLVARKRIE